MTRAHRNTICVLAAVAFLGTSTLAPEADAGRRLFTITPDAVVLYVVDNSTSMDFRSGNLVENIEETESAAALCALLPTDVSDSTRLQVLSEAMLGLLEPANKVLFPEQWNTGNFNSYTASYNCTSPTPEGDRYWPAFSWTDRSLASTYRTPGLFQQFAPFIIQGGGTFDALGDPQAATNPYGPTPAGGFNAGLDGHADSLVLPFPANLPRAHGAMTSWRTHNAQALFDLVAGLETDGGTWISAALEDIQYMRNEDPGVLADPYDDCRPYAAVVLTDGFDSGDDCGGGGEPAFCPNYDYLDSGTIPPTETGQANILASGSDCRTCSGSAPFKSVNTYVVALNEGSVTEADDLSQAAHTCAVRATRTACPGGQGDCGGGETCINAFCEPDDPCEAAPQWAFHGWDTPSLSHSLGLILNNVIGGVSSTIAPQTMRIIESNQVGLATFRASTDISATSAFWTGELTMERDFCQINGESELELVEAAAVELAVAALTPATAATRTIWTPRRDNEGSAILGNTCDYANAFNDDSWCYGLDGAVSDPLADGLSDIGDGSGGVTYGGEYAAVIPQGAEEWLLDRYEEGQVTADDLISVPHNMTVICHDDQTKIVETALLANFPGYSGGQCGSVFCLNGETVYLTGDALIAARGASTPEVECDIDICVISTAGEFTAREFDDQVTPDTTDMTVPQSELDDWIARGAIVGTCPGSGGTVAPTRDTLDNTLTATREAVFWANNDDGPTAGGPDYGTHDVDSRNLVPLTRTVWQNHWDYLGATSLEETQAVIDFVRGETLTAIDGAGDLPSEFDSASVALFDRPSTGYMGALLNTTLPILPLPAPCESGGNILPSCARTTQGWYNYVTATRTADRPELILSASNDGQLYAWDTADGSLRWSFVPMSILPRLSSAMYGRTGLLDGPITIAEVIKGYDGSDDEEWAAIVAGAFGPEGSGMYVLEIDEDGDPIFRFEVTGADIPELGQSTPAPLVTNFFIDHDGAGGGEAEVIGGVVLAGGSSPAPEAVIDGEYMGWSGGEALIFFDLDGKILRQFDPTTNPLLFRSCGAVTGTPVAWSAHVARTVAVGTQYGCLLQANVSDTDPTQWTLRILDKARSAAPIVFPPAVARRADGNLTFVYAQGEKNFEHHAGLFYSIVSVNEVLDQTANAIENTDLSTRSHVNWEILLQDEFATTPPLIIDGVVRFASFERDANVCDFGHANLWGVHFLGDPSVVGDDGDLPWIVDKDGASSLRLEPQLENPNEDPMVDGDEYVAYVALHDLDPGIGQHSVIFDLSLVPKLDCDVVEITGRDGDTFEVLSSIDDVVLRPSGIHFGTLVDDEGWVPDTSAVLDLDLEIDLPSWETTGVPLSWGPEVVF